MPSSGTSRWNVPDGDGGEQPTSPEMLAGGQPQTDPPPVADEGLRVPYKKRKKPLRGTGLLVGAMCPIRPNVVWALDFQFDQTADGRTIKLLNIIDEFTRECLAIEVDRSIDADAVVACLEKITTDRPAPVYLRFDKAPSSSPMPWPTGVASMTPARCSSTRVHHGRTPGSSPSTEGSGTSTSTVNSSTACSRPRC